MGLKPHVTARSLSLCVSSEPPKFSPPTATPPPAGGELYYDEAKAFYACVHGGKPARASMLQLLSPTVWRAGKRAKESGLVKDSNFKGDGLTLGGERQRGSAGGCWAAQLACGS